MNRIMLCAIAALLGIVPEAAAFDMAYHRQITAKALAELGFEPRSIDVVCEGNLAVDAFDESGIPEAHFDNEAFARGSRRLRDKLVSVMEALEVEDREGAWYELGGVMHTVQDFFAHSNFVENNGRDAPVDLLALEDASPLNRCDRETFRGGLTSGYYPDDKRPSESKCVHAELNKDSPEGGPCHGLAMERATAESRRYVERLFEAIRLRSGPDEAHCDVMMRLLLPQALPGSGCGISGLKRR